MYVLSLNHPFTLNKLTPVINKVVNIEKIIEHRQIKKQTFYNNFYNNFFCNFYIPFTAQFTAIKNAACFYYLDL